MAKNAKNVVRGTAGGLRGGAKAPVVAPEEPEERIRKLLDATDEFLSKLFPGLEWAEAGEAWEAWPYEYYRYRHRWYGKIIIEEIVVDRLEGRIVEYEVKMARGD